MYSYDVSAVNSTSAEEPQASQLTAWWFHDGKFSAGGEYSSAQGGNPGALQGENNGTQSTTNWCSTGVASATGAPCVAYVTSTNWWQPYSVGAFSPEYAMDMGAFNYLTWSSIRAPIKSSYLRSSPGALRAISSTTSPVMRRHANQWRRVKSPSPPLQTPPRTWASAWDGDGNLRGHQPDPGMDLGVKFEPCTWVTGAGVAANTMINYAVEDQGNAEAGRTRVKQSPRRLQRHHVAKR